MNELKGFFSLTFDHVLAAVEQAGHRTTGLCYPLNSLENRVYEIELEDGTRRVAKFYRPGRWSAATILDEHRFLAALAADEIPVCPPVAFADGETLHSTEEGILFALFPKMGGRAPDDLPPDELAQLGRLIARIHNIGKRLGAKHRPTLSPQTYGRDALAVIMQQGRLAPGTSTRYEQAANELIKLAEAAFAGVESSLIHADFHRGNVLSRGAGYVVLDFDDCAIGPFAQDLWLLLPGRPSDCPRELEAMLTGYEQFRAFEHSTLRLVEVLRGLRYLRYAAWVTARWDDPSFKRAFPQFGTENYWEQQVADLYEQLRLVSSLPA
jgi:Ser/Thr protein kinase RdoA (MazF antagonist)